MGAREGTMLLVKAFKKIELDKVYQLYCATFPFAKEPKTWNEFLSDLGKKEIPKSKNLSKEEIIKMAEDIRARRLTKQG